MSEAGGGEAWESEERFQGACRLAVASGAPDSGAPLIPPGHMFLSFFVSLLACCFLALLALLALFALFALFALWPCGLVTLLLCAQVKKY